MGGLGIGPPFYVLQNRKAWERVNSATSHSPRSGFGGKITIFMRDVTSTSRPIFVCCGVEGELFASTLLIAARVTEKGESINV